MEVAAGFDPHLVEHRHQGLKRRIAGTGTHASEGSIHPHRAGLNAGDGIGDAKRQIMVGVNADFGLRSQV